MPAPWPGTAHRLKTRLSIGNHHESSHLRQKQSPRFRRLGAGAGFAGEDAPKPPATPAPVPEVLPRGRIGKLEVSRLILGGNLLTHYTRPHARLGCQGAYDQGVVCVTSTQRVVRRSRDCRSRREEALIAFELEPPRRLLPEAGIGSGEFSAPLRVLCVSAVLRPLSARSPTSCRRGMRPGIYRGDGGIARPAHARLWRGVWLGTCRKTPCVRSFPRGRGKKRPGLARSPI